MIWVKNMIFTRIRDLREDSDLSQREMAEILNCSQQTYSNYELGQREIPIAVLIRLALYHKTSVDYLLGLTDDKNPYPPKHPSTSSCGSK